MITINGQKMGKSLGNFITLDEFFSGNHKLLQQPYSPMTIRFFILQAHYRSTVDFSNEALQASEKALQRMLEGWDNLSKIEPAEVSTVDVKTIRERCYEAMNDDLSTPIVISHLFEAVKIINTVLAGGATLFGSFEGNVSYIPFRYHGHLRRGRCFGRGERGLS